MGHRHSDPNNPPKDSSEEFFFRRGSDPHGVGLNPAGESRAGTKKRLECAGNRKTVEVGRTGFVGMRVRRTPPRNCLLQRFGMRRTKKPLDTAPALCFALLPSLNCPPAAPLLCVASRCERMRYVLSQYTDLCPSPLHCVAFWGEVSFCFVLVARQVSNARHRLC